MRSSLGAFAYLLICGIWPSLDISRVCRNNSRDRWFTCRDRLVRIALRSADPCRRSMNSITPPAAGVDDSRPLLICFSHLRWDFVYQRPQHLLTRAAQSYRVIYVEEPVFSDAETPRIVASDRAEGVRVATPHLPRTIKPDAIDPALRRLVDDLLLDEKGRLYTWYYTPMALQSTRHLRAAVCIYDNMDELSAFNGASPLLLGLEEELLGRATIVFTGGRALFEAKKHRHANIHAFPSSIDFNHFARATRLGTCDPDDQSAIAHPRIGFFGVIDERMDLELVARSAACRPDWQFVMIGPIAKIDSTALPQSANIHWLGQKAYSDLPAYLAGWDLGFMPFALNESTRFISPTKTPEFLAAGLRVVSTAVPDVVQPYGTAGLVEIVASSEQFILQAERLLRCSADKSWKKEAARFLSTNSWDLTWVRMNTLIRQSSSSTAISPAHVKERFYV